MSELTTSPTAGTAAKPRRAGRFSRLLSSISLLRESPIGMIGAFLVLFWVTLAVLAPVLPLFDPLAQSPGSCSSPF
jgi:peptide/nickel transport system permease protein